MRSLQQRLLWQTPPCSGVEIQLCVSTEIFSLQSSSLPSKERRLREPGEMLDGEEALEAEDTRYFSCSPQLECCPSPPLEEKGGNKKEKRNDGRKKKQDGEGVEQGGYREASFLRMCMQHNSPGRA